MKRFKRYIEKKRLILNIYKSKVIMFEKKRVRSVRKSREERIK